MADPRDPEQFAMSFGEHLEDLRRRLLHAVYGVAIACCVTYYYTQDIVAFLVTPLIHAQLRAHVPANVIATKVMTGFTLYMKVGFVAGLILASPWVLYQLWKFISAGLYASERRVILVLAPFSSVMSVLGLLFFYYIMLPLSLMFLVSFQTTYPMPHGDRPIFVEKMLDGLPSWTRTTMDWMNGVPSTTQPDDTATTQGGATQPAERWPVLRDDPADPTPGQHWVKVPENELRVWISGEVHTVPLSASTLINPLIEVDDYIDFVAFMALGVVIAFQVPVLMFIGAWVGLLDPKVIARYRKHFFFVAFITAAIITPTGDPFNLAIMAVPLILLFEIGLLAMRLVYHKKTA